MFFSGSRYAKAGTTTVTKPDGTVVTVTKLPLPLTNPILGFHRRLEGQPLDLIAAHYLTDATTFWKLCDANNTMVPDALSVHDLIGIPTQEA
jgi:hypothetical protein